MTQGFTRKLVPHNLLDGILDQDTVAASVVVGDLVYGNVTPKWDRLPKGTTGQLLTMGASLPAWGYSGGLYQKQIVSGAAVTTITFSGFTVKALRLEWSIVNPLGSPVNCAFSVNNDKTAGHYHKMYFRGQGNGTVDAGSGNDNNLGAPPNGEQTHGVYNYAIDARGYAGINGPELRDNLVDTFIFWRCEKTDATIANITQIDIDSASASGIGIGSWFAVYLLS